ncbi:MAG: hypothetical protein LAT64_09240 [Phycisphaerales bacterium]|nr:hypothetical protein [Planctomycetota bacterium]MCH8508933.1 hypothetical protein [Phycisphaerales bacterium]
MKRKTTQARTLAVYAGVLAPTLLLTACGDPEIEEHRVPKGVETIPDADTPTAPPAATQPPAADPYGAPAAASDADRPWTAPAAWRFDPTERPMRLATYEAPADGVPVEVAITRFPGDVGGMLANVNRWRGQIGLQPVTEAQLEDAIERADNLGFEISLMHLEGPELHMLAASIYETAADRTWFVRVTERPERAAMVKDEVFAFARTFGAD